MLTPSRPVPRGATLAELLVALALAAIVLGSATSTVLRQQRTATELRGAAAGETQLRAATGALAAELSALAVGSGDLVAGEARDTALELRTLVAASAACSDVVGAAVFAAGADSVLPGALAKVGDTLWWYGESDHHWRGALVMASDSVTADCKLTGSPPRPSRRVSVVAMDTIPAGAPLRITRPARYSFYRSGDGSWQLGLREWVGAGGRFAAPQPLAGPFLIRAGQSRSGFRYFDEHGGELSVGPGGVDVARVARVRLTVLTLAQRLLAGRDSIRRDSVDIALRRERGS